MATNAFQLRPNHEICQAFARVEGKNLAKKGQDTPVLKMYSGTVDELRSVLLKS
jgi:hypothetical protein